MWWKLTESTRPGKADRTLRYRGFATAILIVCLMYGCAARKSGPPAAQAKSAAGPSTAAAASNASQASQPQAKINISYAHAGDFLRSIVVTKYEGAKQLATEPAGSQGTASLVRFETGVKVWQIDVDKGLLATFGMGRKAYALKLVAYGVVPKHFTQSIPDSGPPEPLEPNHYYIFSVIRNSGSDNYEAVKVGRDGSLESYDAEPRAGSSYRLCCNVSPDFTAVDTSSALDLQESENSQ